ncbi:flocculation protein FLO11-like [Agrilus planipennis]|uniref:Flocculation protein FLO11-like n=1 Tax=Agrilus planipennis TaxID=224129 RepID=A0A1W4XDA5_AGRPL|nr:flocculation protein FLO11-like [Agrilus planipennis]
MCSNGIPHVITCPAGLHFDERINVCNWPAEVVCSQSAYSDDVVEDPFYDQNELIDSPIVTDDVPFTEWLKLSTTRRDEDVKFTGTSEPRASQYPVEEIENNIPPSPSAPPVTPSTVPPPTEESNIGSIIQTIASQILDYFTGGDDSEETDDEDEDVKLLRKIVTEETLDRIKALLKVLVDEVKENTLKNHHPQTDGNIETMESDSLPDDNVSTTSDHLPNYTTKSVEIQNSFPDREGTETTLTTNNLSTSTETSVSTINTENILPTTILASATQTSTAINDIRLETLIDLIELSHSTQATNTVTDITLESAESENIKQSTLNIFENATPTSMVSNTIQNSTSPETTTTTESAQPLMTSDTIQNNTIITDSGLVTTVVLEDSSNRKTWETEDVPSLLAVTGTTQNTIIGTDKGLRTTESEGISQDMLLTTENASPKLVVPNSNQNSVETSKDKAKENVNQNISLMVETATSASVLLDTLQISATTIDLENVLPIATSMPEYQCPVIIYKVENNHNFTIRKSHQ